MERTASNDGEEPEAEEAGDENLGSRATALVHGATQEWTGEQGGPTEDPLPPEVVASMADSPAPAAQSVVTAAAFFPCSAGGYQTPWFGGYGGSVASWQFHNTTGVYPSTCAGFYAAKVKIKATQIFSHHPWTSKVVGVALAWYRPSQPDLLFRSGDPQGWVEASGTESDVDDKGWEYCPPGSLIVGVNSYGIDFVNGLGFACKDLQTGQITFLPGGGINDGPFQDHGCDLNRAVMWNDIQPGLARTGVLLDGISFNCGRPSGNTVFWLQ